MRSNNIKSVKFEIFSFKIPICIDYISMFINKKNLANFIISSFGIKLKKSLTIEINFIEFSG